MIIFVGDRKMSRIKVGAIVNVNDQAWSKLLNRESGCRVCRENRYGRLRRFKVLATNCKIPLEEPRASANTLMIAVENTYRPEIIAVNDCNLQLSVAGIGIQYIDNGRNVTTELSEQSKDAVLRAHLEAGG